MYLDVFAQVYMAAALVTVGVAFRYGGCARAKGSLLLIADWALTVASQNAGHGVTFPVTWAMQDFLFVVAFGLIGILYNRHWAWVVSGLCVAKMMTHLAYVLTGEPAGFAYLSILAALGYASMLAIVAPPVIMKLAGMRDESPDYSDFMRGGRLPPSAFHAKEGRGK